MASTYRIRSGDSLGRIADFHRATVADLLAMNPQIDDPDVIFPGQVINVPETPEEGESIHAAQATGDGPSWYQIAVREMETGVDEIAGSQGHNPRIVEYHQATSLAATYPPPWATIYSSSAFSVLVAGPRHGRRSNWQSRPPLVSFAQR